MVSACQYISASQRSNFRRSWDSKGRHRFSNTNTHQWQTKCTSAASRARVHLFVDRPVYLEPPLQMRHRLSARKVFGALTRGFGRVRQVVCPVTEEEYDAGVRRRGCQAQRHPSMIILDYSFATRADHDGVKEIVEREGGRWVLVYLVIREDRRAIRERVRDRKYRRDCNALRPGRWLE